MTDFVKDFIVYGFVCVAATGGAIFWLNMIRETLRRDMNFSVRKFTKEQLDKILK